MFVVAIVVSALLAATLLFSGRGKLAHDPAQMKTMSGVGFPEDRVWLLASAEIAGALGLVVGLFWWPIGVAAAIGVVLYFVGAARAHLRKRYPGAVAPIVVLVVAVAALVLRLVTT